MAKKTPEPLNPTEEALWRSFTYLMMHLPRSLEHDLLSHATLTVSEYVVLVHLSESPENVMRIGDLADVCNLSPSRISRLIDAMETEGKVVKKQCPVDGRSVLVALRPKGLEALKLAYPIQLENVRKKVFNHLSAQEVTTLAHSLNRLRAVLENSQQKTTESQS
jgi:DNA-binding MarR family transcriptional regulator